MQIAAEHAEAEGQRSRIRVEERLLLDRIALHAADVAPRHVEMSAAVVAHLAHAGLSIRNRTLVPAGIAAYSVLIVELLHKLGRRFAHILIEDLLQGGHNSPVTILVLYSR